MLDERRVGLRMPRSGPVEQRLEDRIDLGMIAVAAATSGAASTFSRRILVLMVAPRDGSELGSRCLTTRTPGRPGTSWPARRSRPFRNASSMKKANPTTLRRPNRSRAPASPDAGTRPSPVTSSTISTCSPRSDRVTMGSRAGRCRTSSSYFARSILPRQLARLAHGHEAPRRGGRRRARRTRTRAPRSRAPCRCTVGERPPRPASTSRDRPDGWASTRRGCCRAR